jgi:hypothetical protein
MMTACMGVPFETQVARAFGSGWRLEIGPPDQRRGLGNEALLHRL